MKGRKCRAKPMYRLPKANQTRDDNAKVGNAML